MAFPMGAITRIAWCDRSIESCSYPAYGWRWARRHDHTPTCLDRPDPNRRAILVSSISVTRDRNELATQYGSSPDSPLEEDGFELTVPPRGKGHGEPLHASIAVSDLKM